MFKPRLIFAVVPVVGLVVLLLIAGQALRPASAQAQKDQKGQKDKLVEKDKFFKPAKDGFIPAEKDKLKPADKGKPRELSGQPKRVNRTTILVLPVKGMPDADTLEALQKVFGRDLDISIEKDLKAVILHGPESVARAAVQARGLRSLADASVLKRGFPAKEAKAGAEIELVKLRRADLGEVAAAIKKYVEKAEVTQKEKSRALVIEGDRDSVALAVSLAKQLDGQQLDAEVQKMLGEVGREKE